MDNNIDFNKYIWEIEINFQTLPICLKIKGKDLILKENNNCSSINLLTPFNKIYNLFMISENKVQIFTPGGGNPNIFFLKSNNKYLFSNSLSNLLDKENQINLDEYSFCQNLTGYQSPFAHFLKNVEKLDPSSLYQINKDKGLFKKNIIFNKNPKLNQNQVVDLMIYSWEKYLSSGKDIFLLLSGGYDSRLNLAIANYASKKYGNNITIFHEYKNKKEADIVDQLIIKSKKKFILTNRNKIKEEDFKLFRDDNYLKITPGFNKFHLERWYLHLMDLKLKNNDGIIMGLGAEAHKGKYYDLIAPDKKNRLNIGDLIYNFGFDENRIISNAKLLDMKIKREGQQHNLFKNLIQESDCFDNNESLIDYIHYRTYICNGHGNRTHTLNTIFSIPFPFLENQFLEAVFHLPSIYKKNFLLVKKAIEKLDPELMEIPFTSGNIKSTFRKKSNLERQSKKVFKKMFYWALKDNNYFYKRKGRVHLTKIEIERLMKIEVKLNITRKIKNHLLKGVKKNKSLNLEYLHQIFYFLNFIEKNNLGSK